MNTPIGQYWRRKKGLRMSLVDGEWFPSVVYLQNNVSPAGTRQMIDIQALNQWGSSKKPCCPKLQHIWKYIYQQQMITIAANLTIKNQVQDVGNKASND
jgi:hypothetical protein